MLHALALSISLTLFAAPPLANQANTKVSVDRLATVALGDSPSEAETATVALRAMGPQAVDRLRALHLELSDTTEAGRYEALIDRVAQQLHAVESGLYWYTDLEVARAAAAASGKPILSLRLLGQLSEELSCANSRFFRTILYANQDIAKVMHDRYILHWQPVRDQVPQITVDFGNGRKIVRTITGNSLHYVMTADGTPVDALPGLYTPQAFVAWLEGSETLARRVMATTDLSEKRRIVIAHHKDAREATLARWKSELADLNVTVDANFDALNGATTDAHWERLQLRRRAGAKLDPTSSALVLAGFPPAEEAMDLAVTKFRVESPMLRQMRNFETTIALDETKNDYRMHTRIHAWFEAVPMRSDSLWTAQIYADLFKTPLSDPWMGLAPPDAYAAIEGGGVIAPREARVDALGGLNLQDLRD